MWAKQTAILPPGAAIDVTTYKDGLLTARDICQRVIDERGGYPSAAIACRNNIDALLYSCAALTAAQGK